MDELPPESVVNASVPRFILIERMKQLMTDEEIRQLRHPFKEYRLDGVPLSLNGLQALIETVDEFHDLFWITETAFLFNGSRLPEPYRKHKISLSTVQNNRSGPFFQIHAATFDDAVTCLEFLQKLDDTDLHRSQLTFSNGGEATTPFPLSDYHLMKMTRQYRNICFSDISFTAAQSCILLECAEIALTRCIFDDGGAAIVNMSATHELQYSSENGGWKKIELDRCLPFDDKHFGLLLKQRKFDVLRLFNMSVRAEACQGLAAVQTTELSITHCILDDAGFWLFQSMQMGMGPRKMAWCGNAAGLIPLLNTLPSNTYLQTLSLSCASQNDLSAAQNVSFWYILAAALSENLGLDRLYMVKYFPCMSKSCDRKSWDQLMGALAKHPTLTSVGIREYMGDQPFDGKDHFFRTKSLARMLKTNAHIETFTFDNRLYDKDAWDATVAPQLERNRWRKRFQAILKNDHRPSIRPALIGQALSRLQGDDDSWMIWLLLCSSCDIIVGTYLEK